MPSPVKKFNDFSDIKFIVGKSFFPWKPALAILPTSSSMPSESGPAANALIPLIPEVWTELGLPTEIFIKSIRLIDRQMEEVIPDFFEGG
jgi:hypothetical protein